MESQDDLLALAVMDDDGHGCAITKAPYRPVTGALDEQGRLEPGTEGWWRVWGASARDIRPGDLVMTGWRNSDGSSGHGEHTAGEPAPWGDLRDSCRVRFTDAVTGELFSVGMLQPMALLRRGTHNTLSDYVR
jgi:hypothetical protein